MACECFKELEERLAKKYHRNRRDARVLTYKGVDANSRPYVLAKIVWHRPEKEIRLSKTGINDRFEYKYCPFCGKPWEV